MFSDFTWKKFFTLGNDGAGGGGGGGVGAKQESGGPTKNPKINKRPGTNIWNWRAGTPPCGILLFVVTFV